MSTAATQSYRLTPLFCFQARSDEMTPLSQRVLRFLMHGVLLYADTFKRETLVQLGEFSLVPLFP